MESAQSKKSPLVAVGVLLMLIGFGLPEPVAKFGESMQASGLKTLVLISVDLFRLCFFAGVAFLSIEILRNRRIKQNLPRP